MFFAFTSANIVLWIVSAVLAIIVVGLFHRGGPLGVAYQLADSYKLCFVVAIVMAPIRGVLAIVSAAIKGRESDEQDSSPEA